MKKKKNKTKLKTWGYEMFFQAHGIIGQDGVGLGTVSRSRV